MAKNREMPQSDPGNSGGDTAEGYLAELRECLGNIDKEAIHRVIETLHQAYVANRQVFLIGNGGSALTASHIALDLAKTVRGVPAHDSVLGFRAIALTENVGLMTAWANDRDFDCIFAEQLKGLAQAGDVLLAVSGSGNSPNILGAAKSAKQLGLIVIGFLGKGGGQVHDLTDVAVVVPSNDYGIIEDTHLALGHLITRSFRDWLLNGRTHTQASNVMSKSDQSNKR